MKIKSEIFVFLIIICILFSISAVSASENQSDIAENNDYQSNMELNQDTKSLNSNMNSESIEDISDILKTDNIKSNPENESTFIALATKLTNPKKNSTSHMTINSMKALIKTT